MNWLLHVISQGDFAQSNKGLFGTSGLFLHAVLYKSLSLLWPQVQLSQLVFVSTLVNLQITTDSCVYQIGGSQAGAYIEQFCRWFFLFQYSQTQPSQQQQFQHQQQPRGGFAQSGGARESMRNNGGGAGRGNRGTGSARGGGGGNRGAGNPAPRR